MKRLDSKNGKFPSSLQKWCSIALAVFCFILYSKSVVAQTNCGPGTPSFVVNLTGSPSGSWISPSVMRNDNCCGTTPPDACVQFEIILDPASQGISFNIFSGAVPTGAMYYQINCGPPVPVGSVICLSGIGPHYLTFCKPGKNQNQYIITSIAQPSVSAGVILNQGCTGIIFANGLDEPTVTWNSVYPGPAGTYNSYLSCQSGCDTTTVTGQPGYPPYVDYLVCGMPAGGCGNLFCDTIRITFNPTLFGNIIPVNPTICFGNTSTTMSANGSGGTSPYTYVWNTGSTAQTISVGVGSYTVTIYDATNCPPVTATVTVTSFANPITANAGNDVTVCSQNPSVTLNGNVVSAGGGIWTNGNGVFTPNDSTLNATYTPSTSEITSGSATLILITTGNGTCPPDSDTIVITIAAPLSVTASPGSVSCFGMNNGSAMANVTGGTPPYFYNWLPCGCQTNPLNNMPAGSYTAVVTDANGCTASDQTWITEPPALSAVAAVNGNVSCMGGSNGSASVSVSGGTMPYSYSWSSGHSTSSTSGLQAGNYTITVTDNNGCVSNDLVTISQPSSLSVSVWQQDVSCFGMNNGSASVSLSGGTPPYSFQWNTGQTTQGVTGLSAGNYFVTTTDSKGCTDVQNIFIGEPPLLVLNISALTNVSCFGGSNGSATASAFGGISPFSFMWNTQPVQNTSAATGLSAGNYIVTVLDSNGCTQMTAVNISEPPLLTSLVTSSNVKCSGGNSGTASLNVSGGTPTYNYSWSNGASSSAVTGLSSGNYTISVTDANGCTHTNTVSISQPALLTSNISNVSNVSCSHGSDGSATANGNGGISPYSFLWSNAQTSQTATGLVSGNYSVVITDANGCTASAFVTITEPPGLIVAASPDDSICPGANTVISANASGGTPNYTYFWQPNIGFGNSQTANPSSSTTYTVIVTDANGCTKTATTTLYTYNLSISAAMNSTGAVCAGQTATLSATVTGSNIISYNWSNNLGNGLGPYTVSPGSSTTYSLTITNICGNSATAAVTVTVHPLPQISLSPQSANGCDEVSFQFSDTNSANSGSTYFWNFGDGHTSGQPFPVHSYTETGTFNVSVIVTSPYGCVSSAQTYCTAAITASSRPDFISDPEYVASIINPEFRFTDLSQNATTWNWDFGDGSTSTLQHPKHTYQQTGIYTVKLVTTNSGMCIDSIIKIVEVKPEFTFYVPNAFTPNGDDLNDVFNGKGSEIIEFEMLIFDRWGNQIFKTIDLNEGWNGRANGGSDIAQKDVYVYQIRLRDFSGKPHFYNGHVSLVR